MALDEGTFILHNTAFKSEEQFKSVLNITHRFFSFKVCVKQIHFLQNTLKRS